jgi:hypothetical protein
MSFKYRRLKIKQQKEQQRLRFKYYILSILFALSTIAVYSQVDEYTIKGVFIEKFTRFIDWPKNTKMQELNVPVTIGIIGDDPFGDKLLNIYKTVKIKNKSVLIRHLSKISEIEGSDILFISKSKQVEINDILAYTKDKPILTIGDTDDYSQKGVLINFYLSENKIRFEINESAMSHSGLRVSYMLLNLAKIISPLTK